MVVAALIGGFCLLGKFLVMLLDLLFETLHEVRMVQEVLFNIVSALSKALFTIGVPGTALLDDVEVDSGIEDLALFGDAAAEHDVELGLTEGRSDFVLDDLRAGTGADELVLGALQLLDAADFVAAFQKRQGLYISCIEEIAYKRGFIDREQLLKLAEPLMKTAYGQYLVDVANGL